MTFAVTETQTILGDMLSRLLDAENNFEDRRHRLSSNNPDRLALWPVLAEQGILGAAFSEEAGGYGGTMRDIAVVMTEVGRKLVVEPVLSAAVCGKALEAAGLDIAGLIEGHEFIAFAHDESHDPFARRATTAAQSSDGSYRVDGRKVVVRHADVADRFVVTATLDGVTKAFLVDRKAEGLQFTTFRLIDGSSAATIVFGGSPATLLADEKTVS